MLRGKKYSLLHAEWGLIITFALILLVLNIFILYPIALLLYKAFEEDGKITLANFMYYFINKSFVEGLLNSLVLAFAVVVTTSLIGVPLAILMARYEFPLKSAFLNMLLIPMILPPFVGALGLQYILGEHGSLNLLLEELGIIKYPIPWLYFRYYVDIMGYRLTIHLGYILVETLHLFPLIFLNTLASLYSIDPSLEEQAEVLGAHGLYLLRTIVMPLVMPGWIAGAILVFIWSFTDLGTPLMLGFPNLIAFQAFSEFKRLRESRLSYVMSILMVLISISIVALGRRYLSLREYAKVQSGLSGSRREYKVRGLKLVVVYAFLIVLLAFSLSPHIGLILTSISKSWVLSILPTEYTLDHYLAILSPTGVTPGLLYVKNSLTYSSVAMLIDIVLGAAIGYFLVRREFPLKSLLDYLSMIPLAIPGVAIGIGYYVTLMNTPLDPTLRADIPITISLTFRRLPYTVRAAYAGLLQLPEDYEEASLSLGASRLKTFIKITVPLLAPHLIAGGILAFINAMLEVSSTLILCTRPRYGTVTWGIFQVAQNPLYGVEQASALGVILMLTVLLLMVVVNKVMGARLGLVYRA
ncbi:MAG: hypothetical protein DRN15_00505 [Thermoprotei archaeon]|nr:MAG: hypothetical protein DRN15_00505 [Thermoprotei archaeon]RLF25671.1 MAG: hypothetical protein DRM97_01085 [Thermoprotei archaeon]